jgi:hypothetical protein
MIRGSSNSFKFIWHVAAVIFFNFRTSGSSSLAGSRSLKFKFFRFFQVLPRGFFGAQSHGPPAGPTQSRG